MLLHAEPMVLCQSRFFFWFSLDFWDTTCRNELNRPSLFSFRFSWDFQIRFSLKIRLTCKFLCLTFFSRKDTKNNSLREQRSVASSIRLKASFQLMHDLHPYWLHQLFLVTRRDLRALSIVFTPLSVSPFSGSRNAWAPMERKKGAVCDCSRQALRDTQIMFVSSNLISPLLGELEGVSLRKLRRSVLALCVEMITDFSQQSVEVRHLSSLLEIRGLSRDDEARKS